MAKRIRGFSDGATNTIASARLARGFSYPSKEDCERAVQFRNLHANMTPQKIARKAWRKSAEMRKKSITLATTPFNYREDV